MKKSRLMVCCVLIFIALELMTSIDAQKAMEKKNRKQQKKDETKDKSTKEDSRKEEMDDVNPKLKPFQNKQTKKQREKKIQNDSTEIPKLQQDVTAVKVDQPQSTLLDVGPEKQIQNDSTEIPLLQPDFTDVKVLQYTQRDVNPVFQTTLPEPPPPQNCSPTVGNSDKLHEIERNVTSLWRHLSFVSQPIHVHVHGGRDSSPGYHRNHGSHGRCHGDRSHGGHHRSHKDNLADKPEHHGHSHNHSDDHSHRHSHHHHSNHSVGLNPRTHDSDKPHPHNTTSSPKCRCRGSHNRSHSETGHADNSQKSHDHSKHHSKNHTHTHHVQRPGDRSHKSHHQSKHHSKSHSHTHHAHRWQDHSHKSRHHSKHHGHKSAIGHDDNRSKGHHHRGGYGFGDRSTHIHIHLTLDEKPSPVHREINQSEPTAATPASEAPHEHTDPPTPEPVFGRCDFLNNAINNNLVGYVLLRQSSSGLDVAVNISGFPVPTDGSDQPDRRLHGFHVHESGDFSKGCLSFGGHFNPEGTTHGGLTHDIRHVGDWGNIETNAQGLAVTQFSVQDATLQGPHSILGRGIVVHEHEDDLGEGGVPASKTTGNAGGRLACCVIGHSKPLPNEAFQRRNDTLSNTAPDLGQISGP